MAEEFPFGGDFLRELLGEEPRAAFFSFQDQFPGRQGTRGRRNFSNQFQDFQDRFLGQLGTQAREGQVPDLNFVDFLSEGFNQNPDQFGGLSRFEREFRSQSPSQRDDFSSFLNPRTRFLVNF